MKINLVSPHMDKGWSFQILCEEKIPEEIRNKIILAIMHDPIVRRARPFLQGNCYEWLMIEFWTDNEDLIQEAAIVLSQKIS